MQKKIGKLVYIEIKTTVHQKTLLRVKRQATVGEDI